MEGATVGQASAQTGWSARMLRYIERTGLVVPARTDADYRLYGLRELNELRSLRALLEGFRIELRDVVLVRRLRREQDLRAAVEAWLAGSEVHALEWEQRKHERLLAA